ncbi:MAG: DNA photolyase family protein [Gammaproteobacteria bacterium]|nr:DNA photolyase family protein [Gammaproteobacteria bacterium]
MAFKKILHWFRHDLRLSDNPSFSSAAKRGAVLPVYILDDVNCVEKVLGAASRCWLHYSLRELNISLDSKLITKSGDPLLIILELVEKYKIDEVSWNRCYEPWQIKRDTRLKSQLRDFGVTVTTYNGSLLWEPWEIEKKSGGNYKVFTPFYRKGCLQFAPPRNLISKPNNTKYLSHKEQLSTIDSLNLLPTKPWGKAMMSYWKVGELAAMKRLKLFIKEDLPGYSEGRNFPAEGKISRLSAHLHWGEISPNQIWYAVKKLTQDASTDCFLSELGWREFSYSLLYYYPTLAKDNLQKKFNSFAWRKNKKLLNAWQRGMTGYPIIDAGMRELWQTGFMHNRVRMIVASFLVKNCLIHWHEGEKWFWDCLVDADLASNSVSWQWVAGCGADAAPFFRIFNPITQGKKFDPQGQYTRKYVPELSTLADKYLHTPWEAPASVLHEAGIKIGESYPRAIVDLSLSRQRALNAYKKIKSD